MLIANDWTFGYTPGHATIHQPPSITEPNEATAGTWRRSASGRGMALELADRAAVSAAMATVLPRTKPPRYSACHTGEAATAAGSSSSTAAAPVRPWMKPMDSTLQVLAGPALEAAAPLPGMRWANQRQAQQVIRAGDGVKRS